MTPNVIRPHDRTAWLLQRHGGIGSSEIATLLGYSPFETPYMLWRRKRLPAPESDTPNEAMRAGHDMELAVAARFESEVGKRVVQSSAGDWMYQHPAFGYMMASPDRLYWINDSAPKTGKQARSNQGILECKSTQKSIDPDDIPTHWYLQLQWQMGIGEHQEGYIAWYTRGLNFGYRRFDFDPTLFAYMQARATQFWRDNIQAGSEPDPINSADLALRWAGKVEAGKSIIADANTLQTLEQLLQLRGQIKELQGRQEELENELKAFMQDAELLQTTSGESLLSWRETSSTRLDTARLRTEQPNLYEQYAKTSTSRRFIIKD